MDAFTSNNTPVNWQAVLQERAWWDGWVAGRKSAAATSLPSLARDRMAFLAGLWACPCCDGRGTEHMPAVPDEFGCEDVPCANCHGTGTASAKGKP